MLERDWTVQICYVNRERNACADVLAKLGRDRISEMTIWESLPAALSLALAADSAGTEFLRGQG